MSLPQVLTADNIVEGPTLIKNPFGPKLSYGYTGRSWADNHYVPVQLLPGDLTKEKKPARSKAVCLPCSANSPKLHYLYSTSDDIRKHGRQHMSDNHPELEPLGDRGTMPCTISSVHLNCRPYLLTSFYHCSCANFSAYLRNSR